MANSAMNIGLYPSEDFLPHVKELGVVVETVDVKRSVSK